jgi:hypothetical protein
LAVVFVNKIVDPTQTLIEPLTELGIVVKEVEPFCPSTLIVQLMNIQTIQNVAENM